jgi:hypothetical protein
MFYVDKQTLPIYWSAGPGVVYEQTGTPTTSYEFTHKEYALEYARKKALANLEVAYKRADRCSKHTLFVYHIRAKFSSRIKYALAKYYKTRQKAFEALHKPIEIKEHTLPDQIEVKGTRLAIGANIYRVDTYSGRLEVLKVASEEIKAYPGITPIAYYHDTTNKYAIQSTLESGLSNIKYLLNKAEAEEIAVYVLEEKAAAIAAELKKYR